jgi:outer membrane protein TolC
MRVLVWFVLLVSTFTQAQPETSLPRYNLKVFLEKAVTVGPSLGESKAEVLFSKAREALVASTRWPSFKMTYLVGPAPSATGDALIGDENFSSWGISQGIQGELSVPLYSFGAISKASTAAAKATTAQAALNFKNELLLRVQVAEIYYGFQLAFELVDLTQSLISKLEEAKEKGKKTPKVRALDLDKLEVYILDLKARLLEAEKAQELMRVAMAWRLGCAIENCNLKWDSATLGERDSIKVSENFDELWKESLLSRPEFKAAEENYQARKAMLDSERAQYFPVLFLGAQITKSWTPVRDDQQSPFAFDPLNSLSGAAGVGLRWNFNFFERNAKIEMAKAEFLKSEALLIFAKNGLKADFEKAVREHTQLLKSYDFRLKSSRLAKRIFYDSVAQFSLGVLPAKDLLESLGAYGLAEKSKLENLFAKNVSDFRVAYVLGRTLNE